MSDRRLPTGHEFPQGPGSTSRRRGVPRGRAAVPPHRARVINGASRRFRPRPRPELLQMLRERRKSDPRRSLETPESAAGALRHPASVEPRVTNSRLARDAALNVESQRTEIDRNHAQGMNFVVESPLQSHRGRIGPSSDDGPALADSSDATGVRVPFQHPSRRHHEEGGAADGAAPVRPMNAADRLRIQNPEPIAHKSDSPGPPVRSPHSDTSERRPPFRKHADPMSRVLHEGIQPATPPSPDPSSRSRAARDRAAESSRAQWIRATRPSVAPGSYLARALREPARPAGTRNFFGRRSASPPKEDEEEPAEEYYRNSERKLQGTRISRDHELYHLSFGMMLGMWTSLQRVPATDRLHLDDFTAVEKIRFTGDGTGEEEEELVELPEGFKFKDYAPKVFRHLREHFGINNDEYMASLGGTYDYIEFVSNSKSGQFFFFSHDGRYMLKTQSAAESKFLRRILVHYYQHVMDNPNTFLPRFYGMHRVKMAHIRQKIHFVVMHSVFDAGDYPVHERYDIKGSTVGRSATEAEKERGADRCILKDNDLSASGKKIKLGPERRRLFLDQIRRDVEFLKRMRIMDYSLLLGIRYRSRPVREPARPRGSVWLSPHHQTNPLATVSSRDTHRADLSHGRAEGRGTPPPPSAAPRVLSQRHMDAHAGAGGDEFPAASSTRPWGRMRRWGHVAASAETRPNRGLGHDVSEMELDDPPSACDPLPGVNEDGSLADEVYYVGIIDILQQYNEKKTLETFFRSLIHKSSEISAVSPVKYGDRFVRALEEHTV